MANHSYLQNLSKTISPEDVEKLLHDFNERYFDSSLTIDHWEDPQGEMGAWTLYLAEKIGFQVWLNDERNIEFPHSLAWGNIFHWAQDLIMVAIRETHGGNIHDDAVEEELFTDCDSSAIDTYKKWWDRTYSDFDEEAQKKIWNTTMLDGPPDFMAFIEKKR
jgi:hypothetical protein